jgi:hypothetical protein
MDVAVGHEPAQALLAPGAGVGAVIHLAGQASAARSFDDPVGTFAANARGTQHVLEGRAACALRGHDPGRQLVRGLRPCAAGRADRRGRAGRAGQSVRREQGRGRGARTGLRARVRNAGRDRAAVQPHRARAVAAFAIASWARQIAGFEAAHARGERGRSGSRSVTSTRYATTRRTRRAQAYLALIDRGEPGRRTTWRRPAASARGRGGNADGMARVPVEVVADPCAGAADRRLSCRERARLAALGVTPRVRLEVCR